MLTCYHVNSSMEPGRWSWGRGVQRNIFSLYVSHVKMVVTRMDTLKMMRVQVYFTYCFPN